MLAAAPWCGGASGAAEGAARVAPERPVADDGAACLGVVAGFAVAAVVGHHGEPAARAPGAAARGRLRRQRDAGTGGGFGMVVEVGST